MKGDTMGEKNKRVLRYWLREPGTEGDDLWHWFAGRYPFQVVCRSAEGKASRQEIVRDAQKSLRHLVGPGNFATYEQRLWR